jgi:hypothetical protein
MFMTCRLSLSMCTATILAFLVSGSLGACDVPPIHVEEDLLMVATWRTDPIQVGQNTLDIRVTDADGIPVAEAFIEVDPQMPTHGHGSSQTPILCKEADRSEDSCEPSPGCLQSEGCYTFFPVTFTMGGPWVVTLRAMWIDDVVHYGELVLDVLVPTGE